ncbi:MAG: Butanoate coenzyme A-transferase [Candidatus Marinimicrobia bacterium]|nr:Butanoate coenzyme A-transferase [Candidatus Neomarinimicrobiota bacterium]
MSWIDTFKSKKTTAEEAVKVIKSGDNVFIPISSGAPQTLIPAMVDRGHELNDVKILHFSTLGPARYTDPEYEGHFRHIALFVGGNTREAVNEGRADYVPVFYHEAPALFKEGVYALDVAMIHVSPPDEHGFCSYGVAVDATKPAAESAKVVIAEVNPNMPRTLGDSFIHVRNIDYIVPTDYQLEEYPAADFTETHAKIAEHIAGLIEDGATVQLGIGAIPEAVLTYLDDKSDLGVHTEMFSDGLIELIERGVVTCTEKTLHPGKIIATFLMGSRKLYDFVDNNPMIEFRPVHYVNDPFVIAQNNRMVAINSALQVDFTGQICADSMGHKIYSGFGGQLDFIRGAAHSERGKPIIALPATAKEGEVSRIVPELYPGGGVVTTRADVHYVVTEYGVANLHGRTIRERVKALVEIAAPQFRDELTARAKELKYI